MSHLHNVPLVFITKGGATLECQLDFTLGSVANLFFYNSKRDAILLHFSVRPSAGLLIANDHIGSVWGEEIALNLQDIAPPTTLALDFSIEGDCRVRIDGVDLGQITVQRFFGVPDIGMLTFNGAILPESLQTGGGANASRRGAGKAELIAPLTLAGWSFDPGMVKQRHSVLVQGASTDIILKAQSRAFRDAPAEYVPAGALIGFSADIPGRIWRDTKPDAAITLQTLANGVPCGEPVTLSRKDIVERIEHHVTTVDPWSDSFGTVLFIEHIRFGGLLPHLSERAQEHFRKSAEFYHLDDFLFGGNEETRDAPVPVPPPPALSAEEILHRALRQQFAQALQDNPDASPGDLLASLMTKARLSRQIRQSICLEFVEIFALCDDMDALYSLARTSGLTLQTGDNAWANSVILPFLFLQGESSRIQDLFYTLPKQRGSLVTPAISWTMRKVLANDTDGITLGEKQREALIYAYISLIDHISQDYWGQTPCLQLIDVAVFLIERLPSLADYLKKDAELFVIRNYGLSREFWRRIAGAVEAGQVELSWQIATARQMFARIENRSKKTDQPVFEALRFFEQMQCPDTTRARFDLLGPSGLVMADNLSSSLDRLLYESSDASDNSLRVLASPLGVESAEALAETAWHTIRERYTEVPKAPYYQLQRQTSRTARALIAASQTGRLSEAENLLTDFLKGSLLLAEARSHHIGITLALKVFDTLADLEVPQISRPILGFLQQSSSSLSLSGQHPALRAAISSLRTSHRQAPNALRAAVIALLPDTGSEYVPAGEDLVRLPSLFDTIIVVISCKPYLGTRVAEMRKGWLSHLEKLGIPYVIAIGNDATGTFGEDRIPGYLDGDILHLDAPDDYEGLPLKTLKVVEWVATRTSFGHMLKIDDDCFLNAEEFFGSASYLKFDYYGRRLSRSHGQTDRVWHNSKSISERGRFELDKSPEPSTYADGGSGYTLSRHAMKLLLDTARKPEGERLIQSSFFEDKMLGDLLARSGISIQEEDYYVAVRRRTYSKALPVSLWQNSFWPNRATPVKLAHLDTDYDQLPAQEHVDGTSLFPKKIWPSYAPCKLMLDSNALEMISSAAKLSLNDSPLALVAVMRNEMFILPHFLAHYRKLGVECFIVCDNCSNDGTLEFLADQPDVILFSSDTSYGASTYGVAWQQALMSAFRVGRWSLLADTDEFLVYRNQEERPLRRLLEAYEDEGADAARIFMLDLYPKGSLAEATFSTGTPFTEADHVEREPLLSHPFGFGPYSNGPTWTSALRHRLMSNNHPSLFVAQKIALLKYQPWTRLSAGLHYVAETSLGREQLLFAHFKYHAAFHAKVVAEVRRGQHFNNAEEYRKYLALLSEGRDTVYDPAISVPWRQARFVQNILGS